jgi:hypothetical protein
LFVTAGFSQESLRTVDFESGKYKDCPITVSYKINGKEPNSATDGVVAGPEWVKDLTLVFRNDSEIPVSNILVRFTSVPKTADNTPRGAQIRYPWGGVPEYNEAGKFTQRTSWKLKPNESILWQSKTHYRFGDIDRLIVVVYAVEFTNNTRWVQGKLFEGPLFVLDDPRESKPKVKYPHPSIKESNN